MKQTIFLLLASVGVTYFISCANADARYLDLNTGEKIKLEKDPSTGLWVDARTKKPVYIYVDTQTNDTIYGANGKVINGHISKNENGKWVYDEENSKSTGEYKMKIEKNGEVKMKTEGEKIKIEKSGEKKVKKD